MQPEMTEFAVMQTGNICVHQITFTDIPTVRFVQAGCPSCHPANSMKAVNAHSKQISSTTCC